MVGWHHSSMDMSLSKLWEIVKDGKPGVLQSMGSQRVGRDLATEQQEGLMSGEGAPLGLHMATSCVFTSLRLLPSACAGRERMRESAQCGISCYKDTNPVGSKPHSMTSLTPITSLEVPSLNSATLRLSFQHFRFGGKAHIQSMRQACRTCMAQSKGLLEKQTRIHILDHKRDGFQCSHNPVVLVYPGSSVTSWVLLKFGFEFFLLLLFFVFWVFCFWAFFFFSTANMYEVGPGPSAQPW